MQTHRPQFPDDRTTPAVGRGGEAEEAAESSDPVTRAVLRQWLYQEGIAAQQSGATGGDIGDIEFAALSGDFGPRVHRPSPGG